jgi:uncharacterized membrane protein YfbV (UPF0208 family)
MHKTNRITAVITAIVAAGTVMAGLVWLTSDVPPYVGNVQNWHGETLSQYR